ncbi:hypothetical protein ACJ41O_008707 [Fusarium nematophilum]
MHVLHGFGQRRKSTRRPRDLHIRKISFSGSSLSSGCSLSSSDSTISAASTPAIQTPIATPRPSLDPLASHPAFHAPPRLYERPFIRMDDSEPVFYGSGDDGVDEDEYAETGVAAQQPTEIALPPHVSPMDVADEEGKEPQDYFFTTVSKRPPMPRSRWSESTIQTMDQFDDNDEEEEEEEEEEDAEVHEDEEDSDEVTQSEDSDDDDDDASVLEMRRLSRHATALKSISLNATYASRPGLAPKRPPMRSLDSVDNFIRRGGWKRRGIVFRQEDMDGQRIEPDRASY